MNRSTPKIILYIHIAVIVILGFMIYANSINGKFVWDDYGNVKDNDYIKDWKYLPKIIKGFGVVGGAQSVYYRPLQNIVHMAGYSLWGLSVEGYHLINILLHIFAAVAFYFFIRLILFDASISFLAGLLFLVHPINTEIISYISGVGDPLSLLFILLSLVFYLKSLDSKSIIYQIAALLSFSLALLSKEIAVIVPVLIMLYHYAFKKTIKANKIVLFVVVLISYILFRLSIFPPLNKPSVSFVDLLVRLPGFFVALTEYSRILLLPFDLHIEYGNRLFKFGDFRVIAGVSLVLILAIAAFLKKKNNPVFFFSISWFFITLLPLSNIYPLTYSFMMEHWLYLPSLGFFIILSSFLVTPSQNKNRAFYFRAGSIFLLIFYSYLTVRQNECWREPVVFLERAVKYAPDSWILYNELGFEYAQAGENNKAIASYSKALEINPSLLGVYSNLGNLYRKLGRDKEAISLYKQSWAVRLKLAQEYYENALALSRAAKEKEAIVLYKKALELDQNNLGLYNDLASACIITGRYKEALKLLLKALELRPQFPVIHNNLAAVYYYEKQYSLAVEHCDKAAALGYKVSPKLLQLIEAYRK